MNSGPGCSVGAWPFLFGAEMPQEEPAIHYAALGATKLWCDTPYKGAKTTSRRGRVTCEDCIREVPWRLVRISEEIRRA